MPLPDGTSFASERIAIGDRVFSLAHVRPPIDCPRNLMLPKVDRLCLGLTVSTFKLSDRAVALEKADVRGTNCLDKGARTQAYGANSSLSAKRLHRSRSTQGDHRRDGAPRSQPGLAAQGALRLPRGCPSRNYQRPLRSNSLFTSSSRRLRPSIACVTSRTSSRVTEGGWPVGGDGR